MLNNIVQKIVPYLSRPLQNECEAVYIIAEIRKILEYHDSAGLPRFDILYLFSNWALHTEASKNHVNIRKYFADFDVQSTMKMKDYLQTSFFKELLQLELLKKDLAEFLKLHNLPTLVTETKEQWSNFLDLYTGIVSEVPMRYTKNDLLPDEIEELVLYRVNPGDGLKPYAKWNIRLQNGQAFTEHILYRTDARES